MVKIGVLFQIQTEFLNKMQTSFVFKGLKVIIQTTIYMSELLTFKYTAAANACNRRTTCSTMFYYPLFINKVDVQIKKR
jgi:hypothetical protein